jgi:phosphatidylglycerophosphate synthase
MTTFRMGPVGGLAVQLALLAGLAATVGLGPAGWLVGIAYGAFTCLALIRALRSSRVAGLGPADRVTLSRAVLAGGVAALAADSFHRPAPVSVMVGLSVVALVLDAVDGWVARRTGTANAFGARFDMEVDSFLVLVLSIHVMPSVGGWVLAIGAMRYALLVSGWVLPWLRQAVPPRPWRKVVAAIQGIVLVFATADVVPRPLMVAVTAISLVLLVESFGRDVAWLLQYRPVRPHASPRSRAPSAIRTRLVLNGGAPVVRRTHGG